MTSIQGAYVMDNPNELKLRFFIAISLVKGHVFIEFDLSAVFLVAIPTFYEPGQV